MTKPLDKEEVLSGIQSLAKDINGIIKDALSKSELYKITKVEDEEKVAEMPPMEEKPEEMPPVEEKMDDAPAMDEESPAEGEESEDDEFSLENQLASMSEDELYHLLEMAMAEYDKRQVPEEGQSEPAPEQKEEVQDEAEKSMKPEFSSLVKSIQDIANSVKMVTEKVSDIEGKLNKSEKDTDTQAGAWTFGPSKGVKTKAVDKAVQTNVEALNKSSESVKTQDRLTKSETINILLDKKRNGNRSVSAELITEVNYVKTEDELHSLQDSLKKKGIL